jgi:transcriptional regulator with XRE-family HTH domain
MDKQSRAWFLEIMRREGYTQSAFAKASGISRQTLEKIIGTRGLPSGKVARKIRDTLGIPTEWWEDPPDDPLEAYVPSSKKVLAIRHINCIGEIAIPAAFRRSLDWECGMDVQISLDKINKAIIIKQPPPETDD